MKKVKKTVFMIICLIVLLLCFKISLLILNYYVHNCYATFTEHYAYYKHLQASLC